MNLIFFMLACTKTINFQITVPAHINIEQDIKDIASINRESDDVSSKTMEQFMKELQDAQNPRFTMVPKGKAKRAYLSARTTEGQILTREQAQKICSSADVNGIISLEKSRYDKDWDFSTYQTTKEKRRTIEENGETREQTIREEITMHRAQFDVDMEVNWKIYSCTGRVIDTYSKNISTSRRGEGESRSDAKVAVGETDGLVYGLAQKQGKLYMRRISPYEISASRTIHTCGPKKMELGNKEM